AASAELLKRVDWRVRALCAGAVARTHSAASLYEMAPCSRGGRRNCPPISARKIARRSAGSSGAAFGHRWPAPAKCTGFDRACRPCKMLMPFVFLGGKQPTAVSALKVTLLSTPAVALCRCPIFLHVGE